MEYGGGLGPQLMSNSAIRHQRHVRPLPQASQPGSTRGLFSWRLRHLSAMAILRFPFNELRPRNTVERFHRWLGAALRILFFKYDLDVDETLGKQQRLRLAPALSHISYG